MDEKLFQMKKKRPWIDTLDVDIKPEFTYDGPISDDIEREAALRLRDEKKFAMQVQKVQKERKQKEKRVFLEAVKKHRKGMKAQLETMLNNAIALQAEQDDEGPSNDTRNKKITRNARDKKYGFGGQKKRSKKNDKESFNSMSTGPNWKQSGGKKFNSARKSKNFSKGKRRK